MVINNPLYFYNVFFCNDKAILWYECVTDHSNYVKYLIEIIHWKSI